MPKDHPIAVEAPGVIPPEGSISFRPGSWTTDPGMPFASAATCLPQLALYGI